MLAVFIPSNETTLVTNLAISVYRKMIAITSFTLAKPPNGVRYPLVGGTRQRHFAGTSLKPRKVLENAQSPTCRVHAVLAAFIIRFIQLVLMLKPSQITVISV